MSRTKKLIAVGTLALGIAAASAAPALASRHTSAPPSGDQVSMATDSRHGTVAPAESRHTS